MQSNCIFMEKIVVNEQHTLEYKQYVEEYLADLKDFCIIHNSNRSTLLPTLCIKVE